MAERTALSVILKRYRVAAGLSQAALAERAELSARAVSDLERGLHRAPHPSTIDLLAKALALTPQQRAIFLSAARPEAAEALPSQPAQSDSHAQQFPQPLTRLIGRERERDQARQVIGLGAHRLLTLTGPGGVGKTRLALAITYDLASTFADGVIVVDLALTRDELRLPATIAEALGLRDQQQTSLADQLSSYLRKLHLLVVLDNFEHLLSQAPFVAQLLTNCPNVTVLATSRAALRIRGEQQIALEPLPLEDAVTLFRERAQEWQAETAVAHDVIEAICQRVDCLPLGIELAAAQTRVATPSQTLNLLTNRLAFLRGGARDLPARQQTMEAAIAWSYDLLDEDQQRCFRALGVFAGGWTLEAATAVCWEEGAVDMPTALLTLAALLDASLIQTETARDGSMRFRMLEMAREFALARLEAADEEMRCRLRHANYYAAMAESIVRFGPGQRPLHANPAPELPNARAALEWTQRTEQVTLGLRLAGFGRLMHVRGQIREAIEWIEHMLLLDQRLSARGAEAAPLGLRAERFNALGRSLLSFGDLTRAETYAREAYRLAEACGDDYVMSDSAATLGMVARQQGRLEEAIAALALARDHTPLADEVGLRFRIEALLADVECDRGNLNSAARLLESAFAGAEKNGNMWDAARIGTRLGWVACQRRQYERATRYFQASLMLFRTFDSPGFTASCLENYAGTLSAEGLHAEAIRLCAAGATLRERAFMPTPRVEAEAVAQILASAQNALGAVAYREAWSVGAALSADDAIAQALDLAEQHLSAKKPGDIRRIFAV